MRASFLALLLTVLVTSLVVPFALASPISGHVFAPNSTATESKYYLSRTPTLGHYYTYTDGVLNVLQDWWGNYTYKGVVNGSLPKTVVAWPFDYDNYGLWINWTNNQTKTNTYGEAHDNDWQTPAPTLIGGDLTGTWVSSTVPPGSRIGSVYRSKVYAGCKNGVYDGTNYTISINAALATNPNFINCSLVKRGVDVTHSELNWTCNGITQHVVTYESSGDGCPLGAWGNVLYESTFIWNTTRNMSAGDFSVRNRKLNRTTTNASKVPVRERSGCHAGYCYTFDGTSDALSGATLDTNETGGLAVSFWARRLGGNTNTQAVLGFSETNKNWVAFQFGRLYLEMNTNNNDCRAETGTQYDTAWHHYVISVKNHNCTFYKDGELLDPTDSTLTPDTLRLSRIGDAGSLRYFNGTLDEIKVWNVSLTAAQVRTVYDGRLSTANVALGEYYANMTYRNLSMDIITGQSATSNITLSKLNISFVDEDTSNPVTGLLISLHIEGNGINSLFSTTKDYMVLSNIPSGDYNVEYYANESYAQRSQDITVLPVYETQNYTLYMSNLTQNVYAIVYDENLDLVEGATIYVYRQQDGNWAETESQVTNFEGAALLHLILNTVQYRFTIEYGGVILYQSTPSFVYSTTISFQISLTQPQLEGFFTEEGIYAAVTAMPDTESIEYQYIANGTVQSCFYLYRVSAASGDTLLNTSCLTSDSGILSFPMPRINGTTYRGDGYVDIGYGARIMASEVYDYPDYVPEKTSGILYQAIITTVFAFIGTWSLPFAAILVPASIIFGKIVGLHSLQWSILITLQILGVLAAFMLGRSS